MKDADCDYVGFHSGRRVFEHRESDHAERWGSSSVGFPGLGGVGVGILISGTAT